MDTLGLLLTVMVTPPASCTDRQAAAVLLQQLRQRHQRVTRAWADGGYTGRLVDFAHDVLHLALTVVKRGTDVTDFTMLLNTGLWRERWRGSADGAAGPGSGQQEPWRSWHT